MSILTKTTNLRHLNILHVPMNHQEEFKLCIHDHAGTKAEWNQ